MRSYLGRYVPSEMNGEDRISLYEKAKESGVVVLVLSEIQDEWERALAQRLGDEQIQRMRREMKVTSNVERLR